MGLQHACLLADAAAAGPGPQDEGWEPLRRYCTVHSLDVYQTWERSTALAWSAWAVNALLSLLGPPALLRLRPSGLPFSPPTAAVDAGQREPERLVVRLVTPEPPASKEAKGPDAPAAAGEGDDAGVPMHTAEMQA